MTTEKYYVQDGVDQGEVWSPILWKIFYDVLLKRLENIKKEVGYEIKTTKILDIVKGDVKEMKIKFYVTAFMDDTILIGRN